MKQSKEMIKKIERLEAEYGVIATKEGFKQAIEALFKKELERVIGEIEKMRIEDTFEGLNLDKEWDNNILMVREGYSQCLDDILKALK